jgi:hypothetical protein
MWYMYADALGRIASLFQMRLKSRTRYRGSECCCAEQKCLFVLNEIGARVQSFPNLGGGGGVDECVLSLNKNINTFCTKPLFLSALQLAIAGLAPAKGEHLPKSRHGGF